jgi:tetratricopeptide (TPR) repeat protein
VTSLEALTPLAMSAPPVYRKRNPMVRGVEQDPNPAREPIGSTDIDNSLVQRPRPLSHSELRTHRLYAEHLRFQGHFDQALHETRQAQELDPLSSAPEIGTAIVLYWIRQYDQALSELRPILDLKPRFSYAYFFLALAHVQKHEYDQALEALSVPGAGGSLQQDTLRGYIYAVTRRHGKARQVLERLQRLSRDQNISTWRSCISASVSTTERWI